MDTWRYDLQNPVELNRYVYTTNNPIMHSDPSGYSDSLTFYGYNAAEMGEKIIGAVNGLYEGGVAGGLGYLTGTLIYAAVRALLEEASLHVCTSKDNKICIHLHTSLPDIPFESRFVNALAYAFDPVEFVLNMLFGGLVGAVTSLVPTTTLTSVTTILGTVGSGGIGWIIQAFSWFLSHALLMKAQTTSAHGLISLALTSGIAGIGNYAAAVLPKRVGKSSLFVGILAVTAVTMFTRAQSAWYNNAAPNSIDPNYVEGLVEVFRKLGMENIVRLIFRV